MIKTSFEQHIVSGNGMRCYKCKKPIPKGTKSYYKKERFQGGVTSGPWLCKKCTAKEINL